MSEIPELIDRAAEVTHLRDSLERFRLVALVGLDGIGKTTLAHHISTAHAADYPGGVQFVEGYAIGRRSEGAAGPLLEEIGKQAREGRRLLVIDDIDELSPDVAAGLLQYAASSSPDLRVLVTSQQPIAQADVTVPLRGLNVDAVSNLLAQYGILGSAASALVTALGGHPLAARMAGSLVLEGHFKAGELIKHFREFRTSGIVLPDGRDLDVRAEPAPSLRLDVVGINEQLLRSLEKDIGLARELSSRKFEELVAELLARQGYTVELTPASKDGSKDIYVARRNDLGAFLYLVECKKYALDHPVGVEIVRALYGTVQAERATAGVLVTTSVFTKGARDFQRHVQYELSLRDYAELHRWIVEALHGRGDA